jgi:hypothetical protein
MGVSLAQPLLTFRGMVLAIFTILRAAGFALMKMINPNFA